MSGTSEIAKNGSQSSVLRIGFFVTAQNTDQRMFAFTSHGKWRCSDVTCESGHGFAKSMGCHTPSLRSDSHELKSQPKNALIVSVVSRRSCASSSETKFSSCE